MGFKKFRYELYKVYTNLEIIKKTKKVVIEKKLRNPSVFLIVNLAYGGKNQRVNYFCGRKK